MKILCNILLILLLGFVLATTNNSYAEKLDDFSVNSEFSIDEEPGFTNDEDSIISVDIPDGFKDEFDLVIKIKNVSDEPLVMALTKIDLLGKDYVLVNTKEPFLKEITDDFKPGETRNYSLRIKKDSALAAKGMTTFKFSVTFKYPANDEDKGKTSNHLFAERKYSYEEAISIKK